MSTSEVQPLIDDASLKFICYFALLFVGLIAAAIFDDWLRCRFVEEVIIHDDNTKPAT